MPLQQTSGAASYDAFGGGAPVAAKYIEDFFQSWLRTGTGSSTTVTTGLNASINKSLVWTKSRSAATNHKLTDTARGVTKALSSNTTGAEVTDSQALTAFNSTGYTIGTNTDYNNSGATYVDWQLVATPKFFDVVTYTGNGTTGRQIAHNLGSVPGCMIVKRTDVGGTDWAVYHRGIASPALYLNLTAANNPGDSQYVWGNGSTTVDPTSTVFTVAASSMVNANGGTYVAYLFAHNAGGFGLSGTDNVISCGSIFALGGANDINLGFEAQFILLKKSNGIDDWYIYDTMRGMPVNNSGAPALEPNLSAAEANQLSVWPTATGFATNGLSGTYIYIAIRRGPMKTPTTGTSVLGVVSRAGTGANATVTTGSFPPDLTIIRGRDAGFSWRWGDRLRGTPVVLRSNLTNAELTGESDLSSFDMNGFSLTGTGASLSNASGNNYINYAMGRAPGFFDVVCYNGNSSTQTITHNLAAVPELMIVKIRNGVSGWPVYSSALGNTKFVRLNTTSAESVDNVWANTSPTSSSFTVGNNGDVNQSGGTYVASLFASCPGVSKVGSYTGTGSSQTIDCGFAGGARFVLIKRTDSTGDWLVWDSARGIVASPGNSPSLALNATAAEVSNFNIIIPESSGFGIGPTSLASVNASGGTYIFLAIA